MSSVILNMEEKNVNKFCLRNVLTYNVITPPYGDLR